MKRNRIARWTLFLFAFVAAGSGCAYPTLTPAAPGDSRAGGSPSDAVQAIAARASELPGEKRKTPLANFEVGFRCVATLKNEPVSDSKFCRGVVFNLVDSGGRLVARVMANDEGAFRFRGVAEGSYRLELDRTRAWELLEKGPFYAGREYAIHLRAN